MAWIKAEQVAWCRNTPEIRSTWEMAKKRAYFCIRTERVKGECVCVGRFSCIGPAFMHQGIVWYGSKSVAFCRVQTGYMAQNTA